MTRQSAPEIAPAAVRYRIEHGRPADSAAIHQLYRQVALQPGGLVRSPFEISERFVHDFLEQANQAGVVQVVRDGFGGPIVGEIHAYPLGPRVFSHVLGNLTLAVHPDHQGRGVGSLLVDALLRQVRHCHPHIRRVELMTRSSNERAIALYHRFGFRIEGRFEARVRKADESYEDDLAMAWMRTPGHHGSTPR